MLFALSKAVVSDAKQNARLQQDCGATSMVKHENLVHVFFSFRCKYSLSLSLTVKRLSFV